ncbi:hypothetical protein SAMN05192561_10328 [Halopenitus malekzadehii]|uniref:DUF7115 domain-containing protein n=1 Tax=Halopenitus malekzadehii TaxID=1267564 RepID=A0A1H6IM64_9EURY|nr:hypothetical protein [Halopenitus malekzadehii]SEH49084.1 hypothetical protein SAMN05192561_10328 [Halopenitus malekzadehii]
MSLPDLLASAVGEEDVVARVDLGGEDVLAVTPTRTLVYRSDGLLSDETVDAYPHGAERVDVSEGRRKTKITLDRGLDGEETITVPAKRTDDALHPILAGVLSAAGVTDPGESVISTFRFSELTLIITSDRLVKHIGSVVWDEEFEEFHYDGVIDLDFEEGTVATSVVLAMRDRRERFKAPNESAREVRETLADAVCAYHDVESPAELRAVREEDQADAEEASDDAGGEDSPDFGVGVDPLSASPAADADAADPEVDSGADVPAGTAGATGTTEHNGGGPEDAGSAGSGDPLAPDPSASSAAVDGASSDRSDADAAQAAQAGPSQTETARRTGASQNGTGDVSSERSPRGEALDGTAARGEPDGSRSAAEAAGAPGDASAADADFGDSGFEPAGVTDDALAREVAELRAAVETQAERIDEQATLIEQLIEELRRGR